MSATHSHGPPAHLALQAETTASARQRQAVQDLRRSGGLWRLALMLGWFDIRLRYRGSILGPFWLTLSTAVMVVALGILYAKLFKLEVEQYLPYFAISLVLWNYLSSLVTEACTCFQVAEGTIRAMRLPYTLYAVRVVVRNTLVMAHNVLVIVGVYAWFWMWPGWAVLEAVPGFLLWVIDGVAACMLLGTLCARFRDIAPIVGSVLQLAFFISPILWKPELLAPWQVALLPLNPFYSLLEIVRAPLLGSAAGALIWLSAGLYSALLMGLAWVLFVRVRGRLAFWV